MDQTHVITPEIREKIYDQLSEAMIVALENDHMTTEESADSADMILKRLDVVSTHEELVIFLQELSARWSIYLPVYQDAKKEDLLKKVSVELDQLAQPNT